MSKVPKLRFPEFEEEWEEKELGEVLKSISNGLSLQQNSLKKGFKVTRIETISDKKINIEKVGYIDTKQDLSDYKLVIGDILFSNINSLEHIGKSVIVDKDYNLYHGMNLLRLVVTSSNIPKFVFYQITLDKIQNNIRNRANRAINQASINQSELQKIPLCIPSIEEQQKIADCLSSLDELIEARREKIASLKAYKKGLLQQLFPQEMYNNYPSSPLIFNKLPKLRFVGFEGEWEEVKLGEIGCFYRGITYGSESVSKEGLLVLRSSNIQDDTLIIDKDLVFIDKEAPTELLLQKGDIVICMSNGSKELVGKNAEYKGNYYNNITVGAFCSLFRPKIAIAKYVFQTEQYSNYISLSMGGGNINNLKNSTLEKYTCYIPKNLAEQEKIANCLSSLDELIEAKNKKIELLESYKKGLLQQMFVN